MYKIALVNMPFAGLSLPSIGLTQLKSVLDREFERRVSVDVRYLNHDFANYIGLELYQKISGSMEHHNSGMGDWLFRQIAFPATQDNTEEYFERYYAYPHAEQESFKRDLQAKREQLGDFFEEAITKYGLDGVNILGFTTMFMQNVASFAMAREVKERQPGVLTVIGGANCESPMGREIIRHVKAIDYAFSGPGLKSFPAFVRACLNDDMNQCERINGVFSKTNCGAQPLQAPSPPHQPASTGMTLVGLGRAGAVTAQAQPAPDLAASIAPFGDELDINADVELDYTDFLNALDDSFADRRVEPILLFETSRGCWWGEKAHCTFCGLNGASMNYRAMSADRAFKLFDSLFKYSDRCSQYNCVDNIMAKNYLTEVFPYLETPPHVHMFYEVKADLKNDELATLSKARVKTIQPGIESLATSTLKLMKKGTSAFQNLLLLKNCLVYDICPEWNLLVGFPGEGDEVYQKYVHDLPLLTHLPPPSGAYPVRFDRYSPYFVKAKEYELNLHPVDFYELIYPFSEEARANLAYYFVDRNTRAKYFLTMLKWLGKVRAKFDVWWKLWHDGDRAYPQLFLKQVGNSHLVHDTRSGELVEHTLSEAAAQTLKLLAKPQRISNVAAELGNLPGFDAAREVSLLQENGLLFQEHDRFMSLVLPGELPRMSFTP